MAEEFVSKAQFNEFVKRMEQGFHHADQRHSDLVAMMDQRFGQVDQRFGQVDQRLDRLEGRMDRGFSDLRLEMDRFRQTTTRQLWVMVGIMSSAIIGTLIKLLFFPAS